MGAKFELVSGAPAAASLPERKTKHSAGYDFVVSENTVVPSYLISIKNLLGSWDGEWTLEEAAKVVKNNYLKPTLVPTHIKCKLDPDTYLDLSVRSSTPLKNLFILANGVGIIDADYYNNPDNEGHIFFQILNLSPVDVLLKAGDRIGQGIIKKYEITEDDTAMGERVGGFGSTTKESE